MNEQQLRGDPDAVYLGVYGTVMCSFGPPIACYPYQDRDLIGKQMILIGPRPPKVGDEMLGLRVESAIDGNLTLVPFADR